ARPRDELLQPVLYGNPSFRELDCRCACKQGWRSADSDRGWIAVHPGCHLVFDSIEACEARRPAHLRPARDPFGGGGRPPGGHVVADTAGTLADKESTAT